MQFNNEVLFTTITCNSWYNILENDYHKQIKIEDLQNRVRFKKVTIYGFVIMPNHLHIIWRVSNEIKYQDFQRDFLKFTARSILKFMIMHDDSYYKKLRVEKHDRKMQVWQENSLSIILFSEKFFLQKLNYIHNNPLQEKWQLVKVAEAYKYSSALFYSTGKYEFGILTHYNRCVLVQGRVGSGDPT